MASRPIFITTDEKRLFEERDVEFKFFNGFSLTQKTKSIKSLHESAREIGIDNILEVSTKSENRLGWELSAFNLMVDFDDYKQISVESAFQGSKVFEESRQYADLYHVESIRAKKDPRLKNSGSIIGFNFQGVFWENQPMTAFYDWIYINALYNNRRDLVRELVEFSAFSDIEFNPKRSINCQARTCAILVSLVKQELIEDALCSKERFIEMIYPKKIVQNSLF